MHQAPREIRILKHLYTFQGIFLLALIGYLVIGLRVIAYFFPPPATIHVTGAGAMMGVFFVVLVVGVFLLALLFFWTARGIMKARQGQMSQALSRLGIPSLPWGILNASFFTQTLRYPTNHVFSGADLIYLIYVICLLIFGATSLACVYYATRPAAKTFLLPRADSHGRAVSKRRRDSV